LAGRADETPGAHAHGTPGFFTGDAEIAGRGLGPRLGYDRKARELMDGLARDQRYGPRDTGLLALGDRSSEIVGGLTYIKARITLLVQRAKNEGRRAGGVI
jgi:hypothetical protein